MTRFTPNGSLDFLGSGINVDVVASFVTGVGHSPPLPGELCDSQPVQMLPCYNPSSEGAAFQLDELLPDLWIAANPDAQRRAAS